MFKGGKFRGGYSLTVRILVCGTKDEGFKSLYSPLFGRMVELVDTLVLGAND